MYIIPKLQGLWDLDHAAKYLSTLMSVKCISHLKNMSISIYFPIIVNAYLKGKTARLRAKKKGGALFRASGLDIIFLLDFLDGLWKRIEGIRLLI